MIRVHLEGLVNVHTLCFDIPGRRLAVYHKGDCGNILEALNNLQLDTRFVLSEAVDVIDTEKIDGQGKLVLWPVLIINFFFFALEILAGFIANSMGLIADSLDMLADSIVYGLSLFAVGGTISRKKRIAGVAGYLQLTLALLGFTETIRRFAEYGVMPESYLMIIISLLALTGNTICLYLLQKPGSKEPHMQAVIIFTSNDIIVNIGVILAGLAVYLTMSKLPDLIVGTIIFVLVGKGAYKIIQLSR